MRLSCPACGAEYDLPETLFLTGPRKVRCVKCGHAWMAGAEALPDPATRPPASAAPATSEAADERLLPAGEDAPLRRPLPLRRRAAPPAEPPAPLPDLSFGPPDPPGGGRRLAAAWAASILILAGACWAGWAYRVQVVAAWPASAHLYAALGGLPER